MNERGLCEKKLCECVRKVTLNLMRSAYVKRGIVYVKLEAALLSWGTSSSHELLVHFPPEQNLKEVC